MHSRREFLGAASAIAAAAAVPMPAQGSQASTMKRRAIGCHTRPFSTFRLGHDELLDAIKAAGYQSADMIRASVPVAATPGAAPAPSGQRGRGAMTPVTPESIA